MVTNGLLGIDSVPSQREDPSAQAAATFIDGSDPLFSMYNEMTAEHDRKAAENWRSDADSVDKVLRALSRSNGLKDLWTFRLDYGLVD